MNPQLLENPTFLRYYEKWQVNPSSVVFVAIGEIFRNYRMFDDAIRVLEEGLKKHPDLISARISLARAYLDKKEISAARKHAIAALERSPNNSDAKLLLDKTRENKSHEVVTELKVFPNTGYSASDEFDDEITEEMPISETRLSEDCVPANEVSQPTPTKMKAWQTLTMARIYASQGHVDEAKKIYSEILKKDPENKTVIDEMNGL